MTSAAASNPKEPVLSPSTDEDIKQSVQIMNDIRQARQDYETRRKDAFDTAKAQVQDESDRFDKLMSTGRPAPPQPTPLPPAPEVPKIAPKDFLTADGEKNPMSAFGNLIFGLSLMATMGSAGKNPGYALNALSGALDGWAKGDHNRAEQEWQVYLAKVERAKNEQQRLLHEVNEKWKEFGANKELLGLDLQIWAAHHNLGQEFRNLLLKNPEGALDLMKANFEMLKFVQHESLQRSATIFNQWFKMSSLDLQQQKAKWQKQYHDEIMEWNKGRIAFGSQANKVLLGLNQVDNLTIKLGRVKNAVEILNTYGILPKGAATAVNKAAAWTRYQLLAGRTDIPEDVLNQIGAAFQTLQRFGTAEIIGAEIGLGATASVMRIQKIATAEAGDVTGIPKEFWSEFFEDLEPQLRRRHGQLKEQAAEISRLAPAFGVIAGQQGVTPLTTPGDFE